MTQPETVSPETTFGSAWLLRTDRDYERWMAGEGIPVHSHIGGFTDVDRCSDEECHRFIRWAIEAALQNREAWRTKREENST